MPKQCFGMSCMTNCSGDAGYLSGVGSETDYGRRILLIFSMLCVAFLKPADRLWTRVILFTAFEAIYAEFLWTICLFSCAVKCLRMVLEFRVEEKFCIAENLDLMWNYSFLWCLFKWR